MPEKPHTFAPISWICSGTELARTKPVMEPQQAGWAHAMRKLFAFVFSFLAVSGAVAGCASAADSALTPVTFTLNWLPTADHGGYFAAKVMHVYEKYGLDVTIVPGGPQLNVYQLLGAGQTDMI